MSHCKYKLRLQYIFIIFNPRVELVFYLVQEICIKREGGLKCVVCVYSKSHVHAVNRGTTSKYIIYITGNSQSLTYQFHRQIFSCHHMGQYLHAIARKLPKSAPPPPRMFLLNGNYSNFNHGSNSINDTKSQDKCLWYNHENQSCIAIIHRTRNTTLTDVNFNHCICNKN